MKKKVQRVRVTEDTPYTFHGNRYVLKRGDHVAEEAFAQFGPREPGQPMSGWFEAAFSVAKAKASVSLYVQYVDVPDPVDPKDARIAKLEAEVAALKASAPAVVPAEVPNGEEF